MNKDSNIIEILKNLKSKIEIEKLVLDSLKVKSVVEPDYVDKFVETMKKSYDMNIAILKDVIKEMEK